MALANTMQLATLNATSDQHQNKTYLCFICSLPFDLYLASIKKKKFNLLNIMSVILPI